MRHYLKTGGLGGSISSWVLRACYVLSLVLIGALCGYFFVEQRHKNIEITYIGALAEQFAVLDAQLTDIALHSGRIAEQVSDEAPGRDWRTRNMTPIERRAFLAAQPIDPIVLPLQTGMKHRIVETTKAFDVLKDHWLAVPPALRQRIVDNARYMPASDPFQGHTRLLDLSRLNSVKNQFDMHWTAREFQAFYENNVGLSNRHAQLEIRGYLEDLSRQQGDALQRFMLMTIGALIALLIFVFIPIDIAIHRMMRRLSSKTREADRAMIKAMAADRAKSEFLANMSHEIRTPMNGVLGMAELLSRTELSAKQRTFADVIVKSGNALLTIINDILDFSKIDADQIELDPAPFTLSETVEDVATLVSGRVAEKDLELIVRVQPDLPHSVVGDVGRLRQVLTNLVGNAVKFTEVGHVLVDVSGSVDDAGASVTFSVEDTGIGIPDDKLKLVFEKFSQVDASSTRRHEGTGLGLAIARRLVQLMGGEITATSQFGKGSCFAFTITLPVHGNAVARTRHAPQDISGAGVLVIEDNPVNRSILCEQFASWNFDCVAVEDGPAGLRFLEEAHALGVAVDLVVLDYQMPGMTGGDVAQAIRSNAALADIPILVLSSVDQVDNLRFVRDLKIEGQLSKPARSSLLLETVSAIIQEKRDHRSLPAPKRPEAAQPLEWARPSTVQVAIPQPAAAPSGPPATVGRSENGVDILVAEDNEVNQIVFTQALSDLPYRFKIVGNGRLALMKWELLRPSLILMDVSMPEMNGHEATRAIRRREAELKLARTPIVGITAHALKGDREKCIEAGMDDYMSKPISPDRLAEKVRSWLADETARRSA
jgi:signal transduction histidine kinase/DNA-binding response OmpR family regulator